MEGVREWSESEYIHFVRESGRRAGASCGRGAFYERVSILACVNF